MPSTRRRAVTHCLLAILAAPCVAAAQQAAAQDALSCLQEFSDNAHSLRRWHAGGVVETDYQGVARWYPCLPTVPAHARVEVTATQLGGMRVPGWGIAFGRSGDQQNYYIFGIDANGAVGVHRVGGGVVPYREHPAMKRELGEANRVVLELRGGHVRFFLNGTELFEIREARDFAGSIAFVQSRGQSILWQDLRVTPLAGGAVASQPPGSAPAAPSAAAGQPGPRTSTGVALPVTRLAPYVSRATAADNLVRVDTATGAIEMRGSGRDLVRVFDGLGDLPGNYALTGTVVVPPCADGRYAGFMFGLSQAGGPSGHLAVARSDGTAALVRLGGGRMDQIGNNLQGQPTAPGEAMRHTIRVDVIGTLIRLRVDGGAPRVAFAAAPVTGGIALVAPGGSCTARFENLTLTLPQ